MKRQLLFLLIAVLFNSLTASAQSWAWGEQGSSVSLVDYVTENSIATNKTGNVYLTGNYETSITFGATTFTSMAKDNLFLVKYDQTGNLLWANTSEGDNLSIVAAESVATDDSDNAYVTGISWEYAGTEDTVTFGPYTLVLPNENFFLVKYTPDGTVVWAKQQDTSVTHRSVFGEGVTTDKFGHEYVAGGDGGVYLIKYDRNGKEIWTEELNSTYAFGYSVAADIFGNVYIAGYFTDSLTVGTNTFYSEYPGVFIAKFDSNGHVLWAHQSNNNSPYYEINGEPSVATDQSGAVYLTNHFADSISFGSYTFICSDTTSSFFVIKYNADGTIAWGKDAILKNGSSWTSNSISSDDSNHIYISGAGSAFSGNKINTNPSFVFANYTLNMIDTFGYYRPVFLLKIDSSGNVICGSTLPVSGDEDANAITSDSTGRYVYLGGVFLESFTIGGDSLVDNTGGADTYVCRWQSCTACGLPLTITPQPVTICEGESVKLTVTGGTTCLWSPSTGLNATSGDSVIANPTVTTTYIINATNSGGCSVTDTDIVSVNPPPNTPSITISVTGDSLISSATSYNQWYFNDTLLTDSTRRVLVIKGHAKGWYTVMVTNPANGCSTTSDSVYINPTGISQLSVNSNQFSIYPNPTSGQFTIKLNGNQNGSTVEIYNVIGEKIYKSVLTNQQGVINLSSQAAGMYFIHLKSEEGTEEGKVILTR